MILMAIIVDFPDFPLSRFMTRVKGVGPSSWLQEWDWEPMEPNPTTGQLILAVIEMKL